MYLNSKPLKLKSVRVDYELFRMAVQVLNRNIVEHALDNIEGIRRAGEINSRHGDFRFELWNGGGLNPLYCLTCNYRRGNLGAKPIEICFDQFREITDVQLRVSEQIPGYTRILYTSEGNLWQGRRIYGADPEFVSDEIERLSRIGG